jgi:phosphoribosylaminoimidazole-succinocarboxamide synthase
MSHQALMRSDWASGLLLKVYRGKVRDVYHLNRRPHILVASDRISAFDVVLPRAIPHKGQVLSQLSWHMLQATAHVAPNWAIASPDPNVVVGRRCRTVKGGNGGAGLPRRPCLAHLQSGRARTLCGALLPEGLKEKRCFPSPIHHPEHQGGRGAR